VSALALLIEAQGIATVVVGLIRPHMERTKPPRGLWVPFPLGRPFGEAGSPAFQLRVLRYALSLLEREDGPVVLEDFPDDAPSMRDTPGWQPFLADGDRSAILPSSPEAWKNALGVELSRIAPAWEAARRRFGRTTTGASRLAPAEWITYAARFLVGELPDSPVDGMSPALVVRFGADDLKALYTEAIQAADPMPSPAQVDRWFWNQTLAADFLRALRLAAISADHPGFKTAGSRFLVPAPFVTRT